MSRLRHTLWLAVILDTAGAGAGEIPGIPSQLPPSIDRRLEINFSNDFLGSGGEADNFRTQQLVVSATVAGRWVTTLDHSILTLDDPASPGRIDQLSATLGYHLLDNIGDNAINKLTIGAGIRSIGDIAGERMQNGFHRLLPSDVRFLPYTQTERTDATAWIDAHRQALPWPAAGPLRGWQFGYWLRGSSLITSDGQWDSAAGIYAVAKRRSIDAWLGLRRDWRSGYDRPVLRETAAAEDDLAIALGIRWGPVVLETVQRFDGDASYGQVRLISTASRSRRAIAGQARFAIDTGFLLPDVHLYIAGRYRSDLINNAESAWQRTIVASGNYGEPQYGDDPTLYTRSAQIGVAIEWERPLPGQTDWLRAYGSIGAGLRRERLVGDGARSGQESDAVDRGVALAAIGLRFHTSTMGDRWDFRLQLGLTGWLPFDDARLEIDSASFRVQKPALAVMLGMSFEVM